MSSLSLKSMTKMNLSKSTFVAESNGAYGYGGDSTLRIDEMRASEFPHMNGSVYLDHAGATMYSQTQLNAVFEELQSSLFTNPHSSTSQDNAESTTTKIENVRRQVLSFFSASENEYTLVFTTGATAALKLIGESFPWSKDSTFAHSVDSHTSVLGIREYAAARGATIQCVGLEELEQLERDAAGSRSYAAPAASLSSLRSSKSASMSLFAFPAECNFSGTRHRQKNIMEHVFAGHWNKSSNKSTQWLILVDAAKYVATYPLNLSTHGPDFVVFSFYKIFGYPTGLGALIIRKSVMPYLKKQYHGGGTVQSILAGTNYIIPRGIDDSARFADGTQPFLSILALRHGIKQVQKLGMANIASHTAALRMLLVGKLTAMHHWNTRPVCKIYGHTTIKTEANQQGPIVACNFLRPDGSYVGYSEVHKLADIHNIHLRSGCFCNPGACQHYLMLKESDLLSNIAAGHVCGDDIDVVNGLPTGAIRLSLGYMTTFEDIAAFVEFASKYFVCRWTPITSTQNSLLRLPSVVNSKRPHLSKITLFPIKSCFGMIVDAWPTGVRGLLFDREFAIVDASNGKVLTLKSLPELCFLFPVVDLQRQALTISYRVPDNLRPQQSAALPPGSPLSSFTISLRADISIINECSLRSMQICTDMCKGCDVGSDVSQWISLCLRRPCALVRVSNNHIRSSQSTHSEKMETIEATNGTRNSNASSIGFVNKAPYSLISRQSIAHFNSVLAAVDETMSFSEDAFRANFIIDGCAESFEEDMWHHVRIGSGVFDVLGPCSRCSVINLDPYTSQFHSKPLQVLSSYRRQGSSIFFGQFLASSSETVWLHVGDSVVEDKVAARLRAKNNQ